MIVVEGPDGSGKTTLINTIIAKTGLSVAPRVVSKETQAMVDLKDWTEQNVLAGFQALIFDRHRLFSEPVYGPLLRDKLEPGFDELSWFYWHLHQFYSCEPVVIYCLPPLEAVMANVQDDPDNTVVADFTRQIWGAYANKAMTEMALRPEWTVIYDYTEVAENGDDPIDEVIRTIESRLDKTGEA